MLSQIPSFPLLGEMLARMHVGLVVTDARGRVELTNSALVRTLGADPERSRIESTIRVAMQRVIDSPESVATDRFGMPNNAPSLEVRTVRGNYRVCASRMGIHICGMLAVLATQERAAPTLPSASLLAERFRLTPRESDVAELLARGRSNSQIASALEISPFTARRHTERVLMKLGARSRAEVSAVLLGLTGESQKAG
jgi:DNA-binding CsgD family transcriptional regulator